MNAPKSGTDHMNNCIVTITVNPAIDKSTSAQHVMPDRKLRCERPVLEPGGGGINVSRAIHRLGGKSRAVYSAGGALGEMLASLLDREGIAHYPVPIEGSTRENLTVFEKVRGQQYRFGMPGPQMQEQEWNRILGEIERLDPKPTFIVASGSLPPGVPVDFYGKVSRVSQDMGAKLIVDTSGDAFRTAVREAGAYLIKPNLRELEALAGESLENEKDQVNFAKQLIHEGSVEAVVISLGSDGATLVHEKMHRYFRAPTVKIQSKVGAGDSMVAGIVLAISRGASLTDAVNFGIAAGTAAVMTHGSELCRREDVERLYNEMDKG
jgi:6-phosphofructokinase 2